MSYEVYGGEKGREGREEGESGGRQAGRQADRQAYAILFRFENFGFFFSPLLLLSPKCELLLLLSLFPFFLGLFTEKTTTTAHNTPQAISIHPSIHPSILALVSE